MSRPSPALHHIVGSACALAALVVVLAVLGRTIGFAFGDLELYETWGRATLVGNGPLDQGAWVYPPFAMAPMALAALVSSTTAGFYTAWFAQVGLLMLTALAVIWWRSPRPVRAAWWYVAFVAALGPIGIGRIDAIATPLAIIAVVLGLAAPARAGLIATLGAWIKLAPAAIVVTLTAAAHRAWWRVIVGAAAACVLVVGASIALFSTQATFSFLTDQSNRGLQIESVAATPFVIGDMLAGRSVGFWNAGVITYEAAGAAARAVASWMDLVLVVGLVALAVLVAWRRRATTTLVAWGCLALTTWLIVGNKVGSPQFVTWLAAPGIGAVASLGRRPTRVVAGGLLGIAVLTQVLFPWCYVGFLDGVLPAVAVEVVRNLALVALLGYATWALWREATTTGDPAPATSQEQPEVEPQPSHT